MNFNPENYAKLDSYFIIIADKFYELMISMNNIKKSLKDNYYKTSDLNKIWSNIGTIHDELLGYDYGDGGEIDSGVIGGYRSAVFKIINSLTNISFSDLESVINSCKATVYGEFTEIEGTGDFFKQGQQAHTFNALESVLAIQKDKLNDPTLTETEKTTIRESINEIQLQVDYFNSVKEVNVKAKYQKRNDNTNTRLALAEANKKEREAFVALYTHKEKTIGLTEEEKVALECAKTDIQSFMYETGRYTSQKSIEEGTAFNAVEEGVKIKEYDAFILNNNVNNIQKQIDYLESKNNKTSEEEAKLKALKEAKIKIEKHKYVADQEYYNAMGSFYKNEDYFKKSIDAFQKTVDNEKTQRTLGINDPSFFYTIEDVCKAICTDYAQSKGVVGKIKSVGRAGFTIYDGITDIRDGLNQFGTDLVISVASDIVSIIPGVDISYEADSDSNDVSMSLFGYEKNYSYKKDYKDYRPYKIFGFDRYAEKLSLLTEEDKSYLNEVGYNMGASVSNLPFAVFDGVVDFCDNSVDSITMWFTGANDFTSIDWASHDYESRKEKTSFYKLIDSNAYDSFKQGGFVYDIVKAVGPTAVIATTSSFFPVVGPILAGMNKAGQVAESKIKEGKDDVGWAHYKKVISAFLQGTVEAVAWKYTYGSNSWNSNTWIGDKIGKFGKATRITNLNSEGVYSLSVAGKVAIEGTKSVVCDVIDIALDDKKEYNVETLYKMGAKAVGNMLSILVYEKIVGAREVNKIKSDIKTETQNAINKANEQLNPTVKEDASAFILSANEKPKASFIDRYLAEQDIDFVTRVGDSFSKIGGKPIKDTYKKVAAYGFDYINPFDEN